MVGSESVSAMMRNRNSRPKLAPLTMSQAKWDAVEALPPLPHTKMWRFSSRARLRMSMASVTFARSIDSMARRRSAL
jgi:hypothetical protein